MLVTQIWKLLAVKDPMLLGIGLTTQTAKFVVHVSAVFTQGLPGIILSDSECEDRALVSCIELHATLIEHILVEGVHVEPFSMRQLR